MPREEAYTTDAENALSLGWETLASLTETILTLLHFQKKTKNNPHILLHWSWLYVEWYTGFIFCVPSAWTSTLVVYYMGIFLVRPVDQ